MGSNGVWCGICAKYLAFGTYPTSAVSTLRERLVCTVCKTMLCRALLLILVQCAHCTP